MCDERERLIGYLYDDCDARERRDVEQHLESCPSCREEIQGLRQVRSDLLAWAVPETPGIWRPIAPPMPQVWWREVPGWALAAAAGLALVAGLTGAVAARAIAPPPQLVAATTSPAVPAIGVSSAELAAAQDRILTLVRTELDRRALQNTAAQGVRLVNAAADSDLLTQQITELSRASDDNLQAIALLYTDMISDRQRSEAKIKQLQFAVEQLAASLNQNR